MTKFWSLKKYLDFQWFPVIVFAFVIAGALGKGEMRGGRSICVMIDERTLEDFITFYIYSCIYRLDSESVMGQER